MRRPLFWADRQVSPTHFISRRHGDAHGLAPEARLLLVHVVDGLVDPFCKSGRERLRVRVAGRGVYGQEHKALAVAAIHPYLATAQEGNVAAPCPFDQHLPVDDDQAEDGLERGQVGAGLRGADYAQQVCIGIGTFAAVLDVRHFREDAVEGAGRNGRGIAGQGRRHERRQHHHIRVRAGLGVCDRLGGGGGELARGGQPLLQEVNEPEAVGHAAQNLRRGAANQRANGFHLVGVIGEPRALAINVRWEK